MKDYIECYIAVLDLLGFKNALSNYSCGTILDIFNEINTDYIITFNKTGTTIIKDEDIHIKVMSDTVCIYININAKNALAGLIAICDYLQIRLLRLDTPILSRGAIVKGNIFHENDILFGQGFVDAYCMQEKTVIFPRVVIESSIIEKYKCDDEAGQAYIDTYLIKDIDGSYISDYLYIFYQLNHDQKSWKKFALFTKDQVEHQENDSIRQKYAYLYNKFPEITNSISLI